MTIRATGYILHARFIVLLTLVSAFGPYLGLGVGLRTDHLVIYGLSVSLLLHALAQRRFGLNRTVFALAALFAMVAGWTLLPTLGGGSNRNAYDILAGFENYLQPVALLFIVAATSSRVGETELRELLSLACKSVVVLLFVNTLLSGLQIFVDTWPAARFFVTDGSTDAMKTVWGRAASNGRYSGVFNQPLEAGVAYSVGLVAWIFTFAEHRSRPAWALWALGALILGGLLSVSKVFVLGGLPLGLLYRLSVRHWRKPRGGAFLATIVASVAGSALLLSWDGLAYLARLFDWDALGSGGVVRLWTAGRFGAAEGGVRGLFEEAWAGAPIHGFGYGAFSPLDSAYLEFFYQGGVPALIIYGAILMTLGWSAARGISKGMQEGKLLAALWILVVGAGIGAPVLTLNRSAVLLWIMLGLAIIVVDRSQGRWAVSLARSGYVGKSAMLVADAGHPQRM